MTKISIIAIIICLGCTIITTYNVQTFGKKICKNFIEIVDDNGGLTNKEGIERYRECKSKFNLK